MKITLTIVLLFTGWFYGSAQKPEITDLKARLAAVKDLGKKFDLADSLFHIYRESDLNNSRFLARTMMSLADSIGQNKISIRANYAMGMVYAYQGDFSAATTYGQRELELCLAERDSIGLIRCYINMGDNYLEMGRFNLAYLMTYSAKEIAEQTNSRIDLGYVIHNFGRIYKEMGQFELAMKNYREADSLSHEFADLYAGLYTHREMGDLYLRMGDHEKALENLQAALKLSRDQNIQFIQPEIFTDLGRLFTSKKDFKAARQYYDTAGMLCKLVNNQLGVAKVEIGIGKILHEQGKMAEARRTFEGGIAIARELNAGTVLVDAYHEMSQVLERQGDFKGSLEYLKLHSGLRDSLFNRNVMGNNIQYQLKFLTDSKDREITALNEVNSLRSAQIERQHTIRNTIIILFLVTGVLLYTLYRSNRRKVQINKLLLAHQDELEKRSEELEELNKLKDKFFSIISHDLRSPINSLAGVLNLMDKNGVSPEELPELTRELRMQFNHTRGLITNLLNWAMLQMDKVTIQKESLNLNQLADENLKLAAATSSKKLELINDVPEKLSIMADRNMMNLVIRNLITNSIKFTDSGGFVKVSARESGSEVIVAVEDNGVGMSQEIQETLLANKSMNYTTRGTANEKGTGLGLNLCREFLERNNGRIWLKSSEGHGSTFYIAVPKS